MCKSYFVGIFKIGLVVKMEFVKLI